MEANKLDRVKEEYKKDLKAIVKQLEDCNFITPDGMFLSNNVAFVALKELAEEGEAEC